VFTNCKGDEDIDAKRSRPSIGKPAVPEGTTHNPWKPAVRETDMPDLLFDHLVGAQQDRLRHRQTERLGGLEVDHHLVFHSKLHREFARFRAT
jgi:hypothetical protein